MRGGRGVLLSLSSAAAHRPAAEAGIALARAYGLPLRGLLVEERAALDFCALPAARLGRGPAPAAGLMAEALAGWSRTVSRELEGLALAARIAARVEVAQGALAEAVRAAAGREDLVVMPLDLTEDLRRSLAAAAALSARARGVLLVPARGAATAGEVAALEAPGAAPLADLAADLARALGAPAGRLRLGAGEGARLRLLVAAPEDAGLLAEPAGAALLRASRASLLLAPAVPSAG